MPATLRARFAATLLTILLVGATDGDAQTVVESTFSVVFANVTSVDVDAVPDGTWVVASNHFDAETIEVRRFTPTTGTLVGETTVLASHDPDDEPVVAVDSHGGLVAAWREDVPLVPTFKVPGLFMRRVGADGAAIGAKIRVSPQGSWVRTPAIAALPSGTILTWADDAGLQSRRYTADGKPLGVTVTLDPIGGQSDILPTADGGYVIVYRAMPPSSAPFVMMRTYGPSGVLYSVATVSTGFDFSDAALAPGEGTVVAAGLTLPDDVSLENSVVVRRFTRDGTSIGDDIVVRTAPTGASRPQVEFDTFGNLYVAWGEDAGVWATVLDAAGTALGPPVEVGDWGVVDYGDVPGLRTVRLANGNFANVWSDYRAWASIVTLCPAGAAVCGDGTWMPTCEACDDGAGNSDTEPDACRTTCRNAGCGDGVIDSGESCDDGNTESCDGCSAACQIEPGPVCGDGVVSPGCEQCDDGNTTVGDGCAACIIERVYGGGSPAGDCWAEWRVVNPSNAPLAGKKGGMNPRQTCVDDDPRCDFDGGAPGSCTFRVAVCANNTNVSQCVPSDRLLSWALTKPTAAQASARPPLAAVRSAFDGVPSAIVGPDARDLCSGDALVAVPLRGSAGAYHRGKLKLGARAELYTTATDSDTLSLVCEPAP